VPSRLLLLTRCPSPGRRGRAASPRHHRGPSCCEIILMFFCSRTVTSRAGVRRDQTPRAGTTAAAGPLAADHLAAAITGGDQAVTIRSQLV